MYAIAHKGSDISKTYPLASIQKWFAQNVHVFTPTLLRWVLFLFLHCIQPTKSSCKLQQYRYTLVWCWDAFSRYQHKVCTTQHEWGSNSHQNRMYKNPFFKNVLVMLHILVPTQTTLKLNSLVTRQVGVMTTLIAEFYLWEQFFNV